MIVDKLCLTCFFVTAYVIQINNNCNDLIWFDLTYVWTLTLFAWQMVILYQKINRPTQPYSNGNITRRGQFAQIETAMTEV